MSPSVHLLRLLLLVLLVVPVAAPPPAGSQEVPSATTADLLVYHQLTNRTVGTTFVDAPVLSGNGGAAVYGEASGVVLDPARPNRVYVAYNPYGQAGVTEIDAYVPRCFCNSQLDISETGLEYAVTDTVQIRSGGTGVPLRSHLTLRSNEISGFKMSSNGRGVYFALRRDAAVEGSTTTLPRGIWTLPTGGGTPRQLASMESIARGLGLPLSKLSGSVLHQDATAHLLDVTDDGGIVVFVVWADGAEYVMSVDADGGTPQKLAGPFHLLTHVAISGDGGTVAWVAYRADLVTQDLGVLRNGQVKTLIDIPNETYQPLQLSRDGARLLVGNGGLLVDTDAMTSRPLETVSPSLGGAVNLTGWGMERATMNVDATRFLYALPALAPNAREQLATLDIGPPELGDAPLIRDVRVDPATIPLDGSRGASVVVSISWEGELKGVGLLALGPGGVDGNVGGGSVALIDTQGSDPTRGQGIFAVENLTYHPYETRTDDDGPRTLRIHVEVKTADGRSHATALDVATLTVTDRS
jgi:hypothetical protein